MRHFYSLKIGFIRDSPIHNDVPAGSRSSVLISSGPAVLQDELQPWISGLLHLKVQRLPQHLSHWILIVLVEVVVQFIWRTIYCTVGLNAWL